MTTFQTTRRLSANPAEVFAAFSDSARLARWWGPKDFRNTFDVCEFKTGGSWRFTMHGPDKGNYRNESVFAEIVHNRRVVIEHISAPHYRLVVELAEADGGTLLTWAQTFDDAGTAERLRPIVVPANEENLDRLEAELGARA